MIISASRRTDIPSYYSQWFVNRLREGFLLIRNPYNPSRLTRLPLSPETTDCIVFWTKNPAPMEKNLGIVSDLGYNYYFQYTLTPYGETWESNLPPIEHRLDTLYRLSERIGPGRLVWRYDPVILDETFTVQFHLERFAALCEAIHACVDECIVSFVDVYRHLRSTLSPIDADQMRVLGKSFAGIAGNVGLKLAACSETVDLQEFGIRRASCIDRERIERIVGRAMRLKKDPGQRRECGCMESVDVGTYGTCLNGCRYCYATKSLRVAQQQFRQHDPASPLQIGRPGEGTVISERKACSCKLDQMNLL